VACPPPDEGRGRGPPETSSREAGTQETVGGAGGSNGTTGAKRPGVPCDRSPPGGSSYLRSTAAEASTQITLEATRAIAALTRRTHRMPISCQRGRVLRRFRQNACRVDTQNAQNGIFLSTRPRCCRWEAQNVASPATFCLSTCDSPPQYGG
jgi:hypothetical protein